MRLLVKFSEIANSFQTDFKSLNDYFVAGFGEVKEVSTGIDDIPKYEGSLEITPNTKEEQILQTAERYCMSDIKVLKIPYFEVSNTSGGTTATIGGL